MSNFTQHDMDVETLRRYAERYRWLRGRMTLDDVPEDHPAWSAPDEHESMKIDAAVDAAMIGTSHKL